MVLIEKRNKLTIDIVIANTSIEAMHEQITEHAIKMFGPIWDGNLKYQQPPN